MKIYDFTNAKRGNVLSTQFKHYGHGRTHDIKLKNYQFVDFVTVQNVPYKQISQDDLIELFGVEAICYCEGKDNYGKWNWNFIATDNWLESNGYHKIDDKPIPQKHTFSFDAISNLEDLENLLFDIKATFAQYGYEFNYTCEDI